MKKGFVALTLFTIASSLALLSVQAQTNELTVYTGRGKGLVDPLVQAFQAETGIKINVRYGTDAQMLAAVQEEGAKSPADIFWANTSGTLGILAKSNTLTTLLPTLTNKATGFVPDSKRWVPLSIRFRVLAYNPAKIKPEQLPSSVLDLPKIAALKGRVGWTPAYASFQDFVGAIAAIHGDAKAKEWLNGMKTLEPKAYGTSNTQMLEALRAGEIDVALTNHYYILRFVKAGYQINTHYFQNNDVGSLALVTGAGVMRSSKNAVNANRLLNWLLSAKAQQFFSGEIFEYPVIKGAILPSNMLPLDQMLGRSPKIDFDKLADYVDNAQKLLREAGLI
jgi:iron(III) transport system substrate-binding protein